MRRVLWTALVLAVGCDSTDFTAGLEEPFIAQAAAFKEGELPVAMAGPEITTFTSGPSLVNPGARGVSIGGNVSETAYAVGIRFADTGSGYWLRPTGALDPITPGARTWQMAVDISVDAEPGTHQLEVVAFDSEGKPGPKRTLPICVASPIPDNQNACLKTAVPPLLVASLSWNTDADVDLTVIAPDGTTLNRGKRSLSANGKVIARLDADGVAGCVTDKKPIENFVWNETFAGPWGIYANLFDACGKTAVTYTLTLYQRIDNGDGTFSQQPIREVHGDFVRQQANGGAGSPFYITSVNFAP
jgi:hypothetical protein